MKIEPSAEIRTWAQICRQFYEAAIELGFNDGQSFELTKVVIEAAVNRDKQ